jgi:hypothetical protein
VAPVVHSTAMADTVVLPFVRRCLLGLLALGTLSVSVELWLVEHFGDSNQLIPLVVAGMGLASLVATAVRPRPVTLRLLQFVMLCYAGTGVIGISLHYQANVAAQREVDPTIAGAALFWSVVRSAAPPALAPGILIQLSLVGLLATYRHPVLAEEGWRAAPDAQGERHSQNASKPS